MSASVQQVSNAANLSVAAAGNGQSPAQKVLHATRAKWFITASGANCTATPQFSHDGITWFSGTAYAAAATGPQAVMDLPGAFVRLSVANAGAGTQVVTADLLIEPASS